MTELNQEVQKPEKKKSILSGIQPTGTFTLGNYIGAVRNWQQLQEDYQCAYFIADLHSLTVRQEAASIRKRACCSFKATCTTMRNWAGFWPATLCSGNCPA